MTTTDTTTEEANAHIRAAGLPTLPRNATEKQIAEALAEAAQDADRCPDCAGGWLCARCSDATGNADASRQSTLKTAAKRSRAYLIAEICGIHELESDEFLTREQKAEAYIPTP